MKRSALDALQQQRHAVVGERRRVLATRTAEARAAADDLARAHRKLTTDRDESNRVKSEEHARAGSGQSRAGDFQQAGRFQAGAELRQHQLTQEAQARRVEAERAEGASGAATQALGDARAQARAVDDRLEQRRKEEERLAAEAEQDDALEVWNARRRR